MLTLKITTNGNSNTAILFEHVVDLISTLKQDADYRDRYLQCSNFRKAYIVIILILGIDNLKIIIPRYGSVHDHSTDRSSLLNLKFRTFFRNIHCTLALQHYIRYWLHF